MGGRFAGRFGIYYPYGSNTGVSGGELCFSEVVIVDKHDSTF